MRDQQATVSAIDRFAKSHGFAPDLEKPRRFSEKMLRRILFDRDPYYLLYANKLFARTFVSNYRILDLKLVELYKVTLEVSPKDFATLPRRFAIKSAYGSGLNKLIFNKDKVDAVTLCDHLNRLLLQKRNAQGFSYPYNCFIIEEILLDEYGNLPFDMKFHCFRCVNDEYQAVIQIDVNRYSDQQRSFFDESLNLLPFTMGLFPPCTSLKIPDNFKKMLSVAKKLASGFDYIRVDLYSIKNQIYFGEITPFHSGAMKRVIPKEWDNRLGDMWMQTSPYYTGLPPTYEICRC